jgi:hypothetical protein
LALKVGEWFRLGRRTVLLLRHGDIFADRAGLATYPAVSKSGATSPLGVEAGMNGYSYVSNNPVSRIDPLGLLDR